ncbi:hypothetical protein LH51_16595 [Nitrincola sp. A-D6]|uniref:hypothetical protein n=1 Tax=Nitrincola sp. A-D6 TaxID=1545442 RepID=UPI00051F9EA4|nr:hypothetical protein [Nitrincola sp. A-D6]KGK41217.1 hypothetical protein LH51_16595 [Nitrincola sp. A-D6]
MSQKTVLLIDGDIVAYQAACISEVEIEWSNGVWTLHSVFDEAKYHVIRYINSVLIKLGLDAKDTVIINTLTGSQNWRKDVLDTYKGNRKGVRKPLALRELKEWMTAQFETHTIQALEADDVMGMLATNPEFYPECKKIIVSEDKDLQTIPTYLFNPAKDTKPRHITEEMADHYHLCQALAGDTTDGYGGCPSIGMDTADTILRELQGWEQYEHTFKSGARKGLTEMRWSKVEVSTPWEAVVHAFAKQGLSEEEALRQARVARILRHSDFDYANNKVILWQP